MPNIDLSIIRGHSPTSLRLAVLSDLHVHHDVTAYEKSSNYVQNMPDRNVRQNPFAGLIHEIGKRELKADFVVCCGDITDQAHPGALVDGWDRLNDVANALGAFGVLATAGNHDVDSRHKHADFDARGAAVRLHPTFPVADRALANEYWARHFCIIEGGNYRIVLLNTAASHGEAEAFADTGGGKQVRQQPEYIHGRVSLHTLDTLREALDGAARKAVNVLVCHHHPQPVDGIKDEDYSAMKGGTDLLNLLQLPDNGTWLVVHGHRHVAGIHQASGAVINAGGLIFCAGSFAKKLPADWPSRNQFYMLELDTEPAAAAQDIAGTFSAWSWHAGGVGWKPATYTERLPGRGGFGYQGNVSVLAESVVAAMRADGAQLRALYELEESILGLRYLPPGDLPALIAVLKGLGARIHTDTDDGAVSVVLTKETP